MEVMTTWIQFFGLAVLIGVAGYHLSIHADQIAEKTGLGKNLVGIIMLGTITSLPELMTGLSSVIVTNNPNLAIGDVLGSCVFNLMLVFILDIVDRKDTSVYSKATQGQILTASAGIIMIAFAAFTLIVSQSLSVPSFANIGVGSMFIPVLYVLLMKVLYEFEKKKTLEAITTTEREPIKKDVIIFSISAVVIIVCGIALPLMGEKIMHVMNWESAFVGTIFMAFATSLPEIAVTLSALRIGAVDMAFSNLLGSNLFNIVMLSIDDLAFRKGPLMEAADTKHVITALTALMMTGIIALAFVYPPQKKIFKTVSALSLFVFLLFLLNGYVIYKS